MAIPDFLNENRNRAYPFLAQTVGHRLGRTETASLLHLPPAAVVDCRVTVGPSSGYVAGTHKVWLASLRRHDGVLDFELQCDAPGLTGEPLLFRRSIDDAEYEVEHRTNDDTWDESDRSESRACHVPLWSGVLVTGPLTTVLAWIADGTTYTSDGTQAVLEPALVHNLDRTRVTSVRLANDDRTRVTSPEGCTALAWDYPTEIVFVQS